jgi:outer membrane lipoprotein carrier protein
MAKLFLMILFFWSVSSYAQDYKKIQDPSTCSKSLKAKMEKTKSLSADFKETTVSEMFDNPQKADGKFWYKQKDKIRWEHTSPKKQVILINGEKVKMSENGKEVSNATSKMIVKKVQSLMVKMMSGDFLSSKEFKISYYENSTNYKLILKPVSSKISKYVEKIELVFSKKDLLMKEISIFESDTEKVVYSFSNIQENQSIQDAKFTTL